jgi:hypothetical protein
MKNLVLAVLLMAAAAPARATSTSRLLGLDIIPVGTLSWGPRDNNRIYQISSAAASQYDSNTFGLNGSTQTSRGAWLFNNGSSITFATGSAFYLAPGTAYASTITAAGIAEAYGVTASTMGLGGSPSGTRKFQVYFNANNNSPSYGDGAVRYLDSVNGVGFECGALYGGSQPSWCQSGNDGMGSKKPFVFQPDGSNVGIRTLSPATTAALEVAGPVSVGGSGNTQYSLQASSGASFGSDVHVTGTLEATKLKGDGSQITGIGGGGTVTTQGSPAAGQVAVFANSGGTIISTGPAVFSSSVTVGPTVYSTTASYAAVLNGGCAAVVNSSFTAVSVVYITGLSSAAYHHQYEFWGTKATAGHINARFNSDSGSNVVFINRGNNSANGGPLGWVSAGTADFAITECNGATTIADATDFASKGDIFANPPKNNHLNFFGQARYLYGARSSSDVTCYGIGGDYYGAAPLTTLTLTASAGTFSGYLTIKACPSGLAP